MHSPWPYTSLLVALTPQASQSIRLAAISNVDHSKTAKTSDESPETPIASPRASISATAPSGAAPAQKPAKPIKDGKSSAASSKSTRAPASNKENKEKKSFAWDDFLAPLKESAAGAHSILAKCKYRYDGATLTIYAGKKFAKTQIDKALPALAESLQTIGLPDIEITVLAAPKPPEDSQTAAIIAMMGGGEEVSL